MHQDMRSNTRAALTSGKGALLSLSVKQKINTMSSTETELLGNDDAVNFVTYRKLIFDWQLKYYNPETPTSQFGKTNVLLQDNMNTIQLERYGKRSSTKRMRHISIRYFFVTDKLQDKTLTVIFYCSTKEMISDYLSKSLQKSLFHTHQNSIMQITEQDEDDSFNAYKMRLKQHKPKGWTRSLFLFLLLYYFLFSINIFYQLNITDTQRCLIEECVGKYLFFIFICGTLKTIKDPEYIYKM